MMRKYSLVRSVAAALLVAIAGSACSEFSLLHPAQTAPTSALAAQPTPASGAGRPSVNESSQPTAPAAVEFDTKDEIRNLALHFQPLDVVKFQVWGYPELDAFAEIQPNGMITLPLVGEVPAAGVAVEDLRHAITERLMPFSRASSAELRPGDSLTLDVWQHSELRATSIIDPEGKVTFPLVGRLPAAGRNLEVIRLDIETRMLQIIGDARVTVLPTFNNRRILYEPQVSVLAQKLEPRHVAVIGEIAAPGLIDIRGSLRAVEALAQTRVLDKTAKMNSILVIRESASGPQYKTLRIADYLAGLAPDQNIYLQHKDIIIVPKTLITKVGDFVDQFLSRTAPIFSWWLALNQSRVATDSADTVLLLNKALEKQLIGVSVGPK